MSLKIICVEFENLKQFADGKFRVDFFATDRVLKKSEMFKIFEQCSYAKCYGIRRIERHGQDDGFAPLENRFRNCNSQYRFESVGRDQLDSRWHNNTNDFFYKEAYYQLESVVGCRNDTEEKKQTLYYKAETLKTKRNVKIYSRAELTDFTDAKNVEVINRLSIEKDEAKYLDESKSIVYPVIRDNNSYVSGNLWQSFINPAVLSGKTPSEVLEVFDESIEEFSVPNSLSKDKPTWVLKFKNDNLVYSGDNMLEPNFLISTGTISGQNLIRNAIIVLKKGGYLLVDEWEAHLNKELLRVILGLFGSRETNPKGACLIFSTHYVEILDFGILNRKDNIYITRKKNYLLSAGKFSDEFKRNDIKKSEIILSNALTGTAPKYEAIERLRGYVCKQVS